MELNQNIPDEVVATPPVKKEKPFKKGNAKKTVIGVILSIFTLIGFVHSAVFAFGFAKDLIENKSAKDTFAAYVYPVVIADTPAFDTVSALDNKTILTTAVYNILANENIKKYSPDRYGFISVPSVDLEASCTQLFGPDVKIKHTGIQDSDFSFDYNKETEVYSISSSNIFPPYTPIIEQITRNQDTYSLTVGYIPTGNLIRNRISENTENLETKKRLTYIVKVLSGGKYKIDSIRAENDVHDAHDTEEIISEDVTSVVTSDVSSERTSPNKNTNSKKPAKKKSNNKKEATTSKKVTSDAKNANT